MEVTLSPESIGAITKGIVEGNESLVGGMGRSNDNVIVTTDGRG